MAEPLTAAGPVVAAGARHVLTDVEFDVLWDELRLGPTPVVLRLPSPGRTRAERHRITADGLAGLRERGLAGPDGPDPELTRLLGLLAAPRRQLELRAWLGHPVRASAAERDGDGVLAVHRDRTVVLGACGSPALAVAGALPPRPAGRGGAVTLPTAVLAEVLTGGQGCDVAATLTDLGTDPREAATVAAVLRGPAHRGQVSAVVHDRWGSPHRPVRHLTLLDAPDGRYRLTRSTADDGREWSTLAPVDTRRLHALLGDLLDTAQEQVDTRR
ncbi:ESX secretion-associated protein EspG [Pseudonocardia sp. KRD291]|uniref:ESX secretion-associated protein EspG n=1 Tax=Pseudonocardia sp. KRD291 TaxID=2792007 RepID=UPI001C4A3552|nr:ESX secretion-associated protein EspG [Pseudonocardia sp. KRD291]MBW0106264.1 ESX secretion-associated protein EspG [Pseudonocardia sp. KRD291]